MEKAKVSVLRIPPQIFRFTESSVVKKTPKRGISYICKDSSDSKFQIKVWKSGRRVYRTKARMKGGENIPITHGVVGEIKLKDAKSMHHEALSLLRQGINPNQVIKEEEIPSIRTSIKKYIEFNKNIAPTTKQLYEGLLSNHLTHKMFHKPFTELNENQLLKWHKNFEDTDRTQIAINCLKLLSATFNAQPKAIQKDAENPKLIIKRNKASYTQHTKDHVFLNPKNDDDSSNELEIFLQMLWEVAFGWREPINEEEDFFVPPTQNQVYIDAIFMMLLTGLRVNAVINITWKDVNFKKNILIAQEKGRNNQKKIRIVPLTRYTYRLLRHRKDHNSPKNSQWVFPSMVLNTHNKNGKTNKLNTKGKKHISNPKHIFIKMERRAKVYGYYELIKNSNRHGLRRTIVQIAKHLGYDMDTMSAILDHANSTVTINNYVGGAISEDKLRKCYEDCHNFIDNRLVTASGTLLPVFHGEKDMKIKGLFSPMMSMWDVHDEPLEPDEYLIGFKDSGFDEKTTAYPDLD